MFSDWQEGLKQAARRAVSSVSVLAGREKGSAVSILVNDERSILAATGSHRSDRTGSFCENPPGCKSKADRLRRANLKVADLAKSTELSMTDAVRRIELSHAEYVNFVSEVSKSAAEGYNFQQEVHATQERMLQIERSLNELETLMGQSGVASTPVSQEMQALDREQDRLSKR